MRSLFSKVFGREKCDFITIVSGLPRSGTSMMMQMLEAGGMVVMTDHVRKADEDNPRGYFELEKVKGIQEDTAWLKDAYGKAFKIVSALLFYLPENHAFRVIFMRRNLEEMLRSQKVMLQRLGRQGAEVSPEELIRKFEEHLKELEHWVKRRKNMQILYLDYRQVIQEPWSHAKAVNDFLGGHLNGKRMASVVDSSLHNQRLDR